jgi:uncharacterized membrane protein
MPVSLSVVPSVVVRWLHVVAAASILGGAGLAWWIVRDATRTGAPARTAAVLSVARGYEWGFWAAIGVIVATGVGNLGALAPIVPGPDTDWGTVLSVKLALVLVLLVGSVVRTMLTATLPSGRTVGPQSERTGETAPAPSPVESRHLAILRSAYALTVVWVFAIVGAAEVLAHG